MSSQKCPADRSSVGLHASMSSSNDTALRVKKGKHQVIISKFDKWQRNFDLEYQKLMWLRCDRDEQDRSLIALLWCSAC